jgi:hypothetical protein
MTSGHVHFCFSDLNVTSDKQVVMRATPIGGNLRKSEFALTGCAQARVWTAPTNGDEVLWEAAVPKQAYEVRYGGEVVRIGSIRDIISANPSFEKRILAWKLHRVVESVPILGRAESHCGFMTAMNEFIASQSVNLTYSLLGGNKTSTVNCNVLANQFVDFLSKGVVPPWARSSSGWTETQSRMRNWMVDNSIPEPKREAMRNGLLSEGFV